MSSKDAIELAQSRWIVVGAPSLLDNAADADPLQLPWVWTDEMPGEIAELRRAGVDIEALAKVEMGSASLHWQATRRGLGLSLASEHVAREDIAAGRLVELPLPGLSTGAYYAVVPKGPRREIVDSFVAWLRGVF